MVSVIMITYGHEKFIRQAIDGVLMQECTFPMELIIADDCSPDGTKAIVEDYINNHPRGHLIKYFRHEKNIGVMPNAMFALSKGGEFIALCEGDDYWTDPKKLQTQVEFLNNNKSYMFSFHDCIIIDENGQVLKNSKLGKSGRKDLSSKEIITGSLMPTLSVVYRNIYYLTKLPEGMAKVKNGDTFLFALLAQYGTAKFHSDIQNAVYRVHVGGIWSLLSNEKRIVHSIATFKEIYKHISPKYKFAVGKRINERYGKLCFMLLDQKKYLELLKIYLFLTFRSLLYLDVKRFLSVGKNLIKKAFFSPQTT